MAWSRSAEGEVEESGEAGDLGDLGEVGEVGDFGGENAPSMPIALFVFFFKLPHPFVFFFPGTTGTGLGKGMR